ncbi:MAG: nicotinate (nicotinamide) nucleotide adenylyltransferase [Bryobacteraceae bacterium]|jgi:nicotinate-nucleotide adenylyltransferase
MKHIALFGGTFDPIHNAHIEIARAAAGRFDLEKILFIPAANPPHKPEGAVASYEDRVRMAELACAVDSRFEVSRIEEGSARSYSILTIEKLKACGIGPLSFVIGGDAFAEIRTWYRWQDVVASVEFIVVTRPGAGWKTPPGAIVHELTGLQLPISSSEIRAQLMRGAPGVPVPGPVLNYIREHGLYGSR